jgi:hypothetical protein
MKTPLILIAIFFAAAVCAAPQPQPLGKVGSYPSGHTQSANYCLGNRWARFQHKAQRFAVPNGLGLPVTSRAPAEALGGDQAQAVSQPFG